MAKNFNILAITYWSFNDALIQAYTLPYLKIIQEINPKSEITLITHEQDSKNKKWHTEQIRTKLKPLNINWYETRYIPFGISALFMQLKNLMAYLRLIKKREIDVIHVWGTPAGVIGYILSILTGKKLIIDSYEPHAEAQVENGTWSKNSLGFRLLWFFERKQSKRASHLIYTTKNMVTYAKEKYGVEKDHLIKPACVDLDLFQRDEPAHDKLKKELGITNEIVAVYSGKLGGIYLEQEVFDCLKVAHDFWKGNFKFLFLTNESRTRIDSFCKQSNLDAHAVISLKVGHSEVPNYLGIADFALTPVKPVPTKRCCTPIKDGEYWAMGLPVIIPAHISDDSDIIETNKIGAILTSLDQKGYTSAINSINELLQGDRSELRNKIRTVAEQNRNFSLAKDVYQKIYG